MITGEYLFKHPELCTKEDLKELIINSKNIIHNETLNLQKLDLPNQQHSIIWERQISEKSIKWYKRVVKTAEAELVSRP